MPRKNIGMLLALCLLNLGLVHARDDDDGVCNSNCRQECSAKVSGDDTDEICRNHCKAKCSTLVSDAQHVFSGPVVATPTACTEAPTNASAERQPTCSRDTGKVLAKFCVPGATVSVIIVCQDGTNGQGVVISTDITHVNSDTCSFNGVFRNRCTGNNCVDQAGKVHTYCSGLLVVNTPPDAATRVPDPGWATCTRAGCPSP
jgi:hypothetical protein